MRISRRVKTAAAFLCPRFIENGSMVALNAQNNLGLSGTEAPPTYFVNCA